MANSQEVLDQLSELRLTADETRTLELGEVEKGVQFDHAVVCKLLTTRPYNSKTFVNTMGVAWRTSKTMSYEDLGNNTFVFEFSNSRDKDKVLSGGSWNFRNCPLVFIEYDGNLRPTEMVFRYLSLWVRIYDLPLNYRSDKTVRAVGGMCGNVEQVDKEMWGEYCRVNVSLDITKPLRRGVLLKTLNSRSERGEWYPLKYEKLPHFCFYCGIVGVDMCQCHEKNFKEGDKIYGDTLKVNGTAQELTVGRISKQFRKCTDLEKEIPSSGVGNERVACQFLPACEQLRKRKLAINPLCARCKQHEETLFHVFRKCVIAKEVWDQMSAAGYLSTRPDLEANSSSVKEWLEAMFKLMSASESQMLAYVCWVLWNDRNNVWMGEPGRDAGALVQQVLSLTQEVNNLQARTNTAGGGSNSVQWTVPQSGWVKMNSDVALDTRLNKAGLGFAIRDENGAILMHGARLVVGEFGVLMGEAMAIREGLTRERNFGCRKVQAESDSQQLVRLFHSGNSDFSEIGPLLRDIKDLIMGFDSFSLNYIPREANSLAHNCAKQAVESNNSFGCNDCYDLHVHRHEE